MAKTWQPKIIPFDNLTAKIESLRQTYPYKKPFDVVATNGCFELIHPGHVDYLEKAAALGQILVVGINSDEGLLGYKRQIRTPYNQNERAKLLSALECVDYVTIFPGKTATEFLSKVRPDIYVKASDYTIETLNFEEKIELEKCGAEIQIIPFLQGYSTSDIIKKIKNYG